MAVVCSPPDHIPEGWSVGVRVRGKDRRQEEEEEGKQTKAPWALVLVRVEKKEDNSGVIFHILNNLNIKKKYCMN